MALLEIPEHDLLSNSDLLAHHEFATGLASNLPSTAPILLADARYPTSVCDWLRVTYPTGNSTSDLSTGQDDSESLLESTMDLGFETGLASNLPSNVRILLADARYPTSVCDWSRVSCPTGNSMGDLLMESGEFEPHLESTMDLGFGTGLASGLPSTAPIQFVDARYPTPVCDWWKVTYPTGNSTSDLLMESGEFEPHLESTMDLGFETEFASGLPSNVTILLADARNQDFVNDC
jgi:hypothetical protein